jgi:hypothetical protein
MKLSQIQWCHGTLNPVMGCDGCELAPPSGTIRHEFIAALSRLVPHVPVSDLENQVANILGDRHLSETYRDREAIAAALLKPYEEVATRASHQTLVDVVRRAAKCYALLLGTMRGGHAGYGRSGGGLPP